MGVADLRDSFNAVASPHFTCTEAFLLYESGPGPGGAAAQFQILKFSGRTEAGNGFEVKSDPLGPDADVNAVAGEVAKKLLDNPPHE